MALLHYLWSRVAANNSSADSAVNWAEGQAPSSVNDSARAMMASAAGFRDDIAGAIVTGGTSTAYTVGSYQVFNSLANMNGQMIAFTPHTTSGATVTLNVDGLGAKPLRSAPSTELLAGVLIQGTPYLAVYNNSDAAWYLHGLYGNPYNVPILGGLDYWDTVAPNSSFIFPAGQAISRTTYATAFARWGTTYGVGDGSTTFNVPDKTGRVSAMKEAVATRLTTAAVGIDGATMGAAGGGSQTLVTGNLPPYTPAGTIGGTGTTALHIYNGVAATSLGSSGIGFGWNNSPAVGTLTYTFSGTAQGGTSTPVKIAQPTIICNYIIRII